MLRPVVTTALRKGVTEGSEPWLAVGIAGTALKLLKKLMDEEPKILFSEKIKPNETVIITQRSRSPKTAR